MADLHITEADRDTLWRSTVVNDLHYKRGYAIEDIAKIVNCTPAHARALLNPPPPPAVLNGKKEPK